MDTKPYQKLPNDVFFGKHVCIVILDLISGVQYNTENQQGPKFEAMTSFADLLTSGHRLLKIIKIQLMCSETVERKLHFEL